jgi:diguanylate cyclase (GGDEF)-like protein
LVFWMIRTTPSTQAVAFFLYMAPKNLAVLYLVQGAWSLHRPGARLVSAPGLIGAGLVLPLVGAWAFATLDLLGVGQQLIIGLIFVPTGIALVRSRDRALSWLAVAFLVRGSLCLIEAAAYASQVAPAGMFTDPVRARIGTFLAVHSSFDSGAEWLLALGFVLALSLRAQRELGSTISELHQTQEGLRRLVDHDPLTALQNRRALPGLLRSVQPEGAALLFFDLDDFKGVNDRLGHEAGDRTLRRFADVLRESFRPNDAFVRYGGDEFLVVAPGLDRELADSRVEAVRGRLAEAQGEESSVRFSVGIALLEAGGRPEEALRTADRLMYEAKQSRASRR